MSYEEYWNAEPDRVRAYRKAEELRNRRQNEVLWMQGLYIREALISTVGNMFSKHSKFEYPKEPYPVTVSQLEERREREEQLKQERMKAQFAAFAERLRQKMP